MSAPSGARMSRCKTYRWHLWRTWRPTGTRLLAIGLNPSTADANTDDPTLRRLLRFADDWGHGGLDLCNLFAFRATDPQRLRHVDDPIGPRNDAMLRARARAADQVLLCWGAWEPKEGGDESVLHMISGQSLTCLGRTRHGHPRHPLYVKASTLPQAW